MKDRLNFEARYPQPPSEVWRALTDPEALAKWLLPNDFQPTLGHKFEFRSQDGKHRIACEVLEVEEGKRLSFTWENKGENQAENKGENKEDGGADEPLAVVSWTLQPDDDGGTRLSLEHRVLEEAEPYVLIETGMNWRNALRAMAGRMPVPIVYVQDEPEEAKLRYAGFRDREPKGDSKEEPTACK